MTESLPLMMTMGCTLYKMLPGEVIRATTIHAAKSMGKERQIGSLEIGKQADLLLLDIPELPLFALPFRCGSHGDRSSKKGKVVYPPPHPRPFAKAGSQDGLLFTMRFNVRNELNDP